MFIYYKLITPIVLTINNVLIIFYSKLLTLQSNVTIVYIKVSFLHYIVKCLKSFIDRFEMHICFLLSSIIFFFLIKNLHSIRLVSRKATAVR